MGLFKTIGKILGVCSLAANVAFAEEKPLEDRVSAPKRVVAPYFLSNDHLASPLDGFEANSSQWLTFNESVGKASDVIGELKLDEFWFSRAGLVLLQGYLGECSNYFSREIAHGFYSAEHSPRDRADWMNFELGRPSDNFIFFRNTKNMDLPFLASTFDIDGFIVSITSGINQQEENLRLLHEECVREDRIFFDEGLLFAINKLQPLKYLFKDKDFDDFSVQSVYSGEEKIPDLVGYSEGLRLKGINVTKKDLTIQNGIAMLGCLPLYYNLYAIGNYLVTGERSVGQAEISTPVGGISLPLVSYYLTKNGGFYNISAFVRAKNGLLFEGEFGIDVDAIGAGKVNTFRLGTKVFDLGFEGRYLPRISPYVYVDFKREEILYDGFVAGAEITVPYPFKGGRSAAVVTKIEYSEKDIIENDIKMEPDGLNVSVGVRFRF